MGKELTELIFILDKSGSMAGLEEDTIGGYNLFLEKQKAVGGQCQVTTVFFNHDYQLLHNRVPLEKIEPIDADVYRPGGYTALLDAVGRTIQNTKYHLPEGAKVLCVIITDGLENSSKEYSVPAVKRLIEQQKAAGWDFIFLGANIDAVKTAGSFGISADRAQNFHSDEAGIGLSFQVLAEAATSFRENFTLKDNWEGKLAEDFQARKPKA